MFQTTNQVSIDLIDGSLRYSKYETLIYQQLTQERTKRIGITISYNCHGATGNCCRDMSCPKSHRTILVGGFNPSENSSQLGLFFQIMFQSTNPIWFIIDILWCILWGYTMIFLAPSSITSAPVSCRNHRLWCWTAGPAPALDNSPPEQASSQRLRHEKAWWLIMIQFRDSRIYQNTNWHARGRNVF